MKANFREEFLAASMTLDMSNTDKLAMYTSEARKADISILPPCINASDVDFLPGEKSIRYSLAALKNIGAQAVESVVEERCANGPFADLSDFARRCNVKALNKRALETLSAAGAFDVLGPNRALVNGNVEQVLAFASRLASNEEQGTADLFGGTGAAEARIDMRPTHPWTPMVQLQQEFDAIGFFLSGHPLDAYASALPKLGVSTYAELEARADRGAAAGRVAGIVVSVRERRSQKGNKFAFAMFSEPTGQFEVVIFSEALAASRQLLETGTAVLLTVEGERDGEALKLRAQAIQSLDEAASTVQRGLKIVLDADVLAKNGSSNLAALDERLKGGGKGEVAMSFYVRGREVNIAFPRRRFDVSPAQKGAISTVPGVLEVLDI
jgi:DNA polymerase III subunit alpha